MLKQQLNYAVSGKIKSTAFLIVTIEASGFTNFFKNKCFFYKLLIIILNPLDIKISKTYNYIE